MTGRVRVVIVGGGIGGFACAQRLAKRGAGLHITLVDPKLRHDFAPSFLWLMTGQRTPERVSRSLSSLARAGVQLIEAEVTAVDPTAGTVALGKGAVRATLAGATAMSAAVCRAIRETPSWRTI